MLLSAVVLLITGCGEEVVLENKSEIALLKVELDNLQAELAESNTKLAELELKLSLAQEDIDWLESSEGGSSEEEEETLAAENRVLLEEQAAQIEGNSLLLIEQSAAVDLLLSSGLLELGSYLSINSAEQLITISGANVMINNGSGLTENLNGLGNVIIGYNVLDSDVRTGSHNLIIGDKHSYYASASILSGYNHRAGGAHIALLGGSSNQVTADAGVIAGGESGSISDSGHHFIGGGFGGQINGGYHNVTLGGIDPTVETATYSVVVGGESNTINDTYDSVVVGGDGNEVDGYDYVSFFGQMSAEASGDEQVSASSATEE